MMLPPGLDINQLMLRSRAGLVLDAVSFSVSAGTLTALTGPAGSGKTALMRILAGDCSQKSGTVSMDGVVLSRRPSARRDFGIVAQPELIYPHLSLVETVAQPLRLRGIRRAERLAMACDTLDLVQLDAPADTRISEASAADTQRALLARAAVFSPKVMLLDEPFPHGDGTVRASLIAALGRIHDMLGATILFATRSLRSTLPIADEIIVLRQGRLEQAASPEEVFNRPASAFVASLFGETNRLAGTLSGTEDDIATVHLACGPTVEARQTDVMSVGEPCLFVLRPEHIAVAPVPAAEMGEGSLDATLIEAQFWGDSYRLRLLIGSGAELVVRRPAITGLRGLAPGRPCAVAWQSHHAMVFASPSS